jgi:prepilin-type N-terminal cleavage/methylation domain-containing protein
MFKAALTNHRRTVTRLQGGFTLVELMAVVTITGVLAALAVVAFRHRLAASRGAEAVSVMTAIGNAEEMYKAENHIYLNVSTASGGNQWYPVLVPGKAQHNWATGATLDATRWRALAPPISQLVRFAYLANAGVAGSTVPALNLTQGPNFSAAIPVDWYVLQAKGDTDGDGVFATYATSSMTGEVYIENEGE